MIKRLHIIISSGGKHPIFSLPLYHLEQKELIYNLYLFWQVFQAGPSRPDALATSRG